MVSRRKEGSVCHSFPKSIPSASRNHLGVNPISGMAAYCASKAALDHFSASLMLEVRHRGVKVTTIAPGSVDTSFAGVPPAADTSWMLTAEDIAATVIDLLEARDAAHLSRLEMRPARPQKR